MLSKFIYTPLLIVVAVLLYLTIWKQNISLALYLVPFVLLLAATYSLSPAIDWWWAQKHPPQLPEALIKFWEKHLPFFRNLSIANKKKFSDRVALYMMATDFTPQGPDNVPEDIKASTAASIVQLTFGQDDYRMQTFEKIIVYPTNFPSLLYPKHLHASEIFEEDGDGCMIIAADHLMPAAVNPTKYYNIALHEYAKIYKLTYPNNPYPEFDYSAWRHLEKISGFSKEWLDQYMGLPDLEPLPVSINYFFTFPQRFKQVLPEIYQTYCGIFNVDPLEGEDPVIDLGKLTTEI